MAIELEDLTDIVCRIGRIPAVGVDEDFYDAGFSSVSALELLFELESSCQVSIPDDRFIEARTVRQLRCAIDDLLQEQAK